MQVVAIQDANIIIDLVKIELFVPCLKLPYQFITTDLIFYSELNETQVTFIQPHIQSGRFTLIQIPAEDLSAIKAASKENTRLSEQDWSALYYAQKLNAILMTGDKRLKELALAKDIPVCGILWILDELLKQVILVHAEAVDYLKDLMQKNKWLPLHECEARLKEWEKHI